MVEVEHFTSATHASNPQQREHQKDTRTKSSSESHQFPPVRTVRVTHTRLNPTCALNGVIADTAVLTLSLAFPTLNTDTVSERLRRWTRNPLGSARRGSNPLGVAFAAQGGVHNKRQTRTLDVRWKQSGMVSHPLCVREALCSTPACPFATAVGAKKNEPNQYKTPTVGLEPTTTRLRALRSAD